MRSGINRSRLLYDISKGLRGDLFDVAYLTAAQRRKEIEGK